MQNIRKSVAKLRRSLPSLLVLAVLGASQACDSQGKPPETAELLLTNARIVDPRGQEVRRGNLLIRDGFIVDAPDRIPPGFTGTTLDLDGKWIIPGLTEMHTHSFGNQVPGGSNDSPGTAAIAQRMLYAGVTGFVDLFGSEEDLYLVRERQRAGEMGGADFFTSLSCLTATEGHCTEYGIPTRTMDSPQDARRVVTELLRKRPDVIKIVYQPTDDQPSIDKATLAAAVALATKHAVKTIVHIKTWQDVRDAVEVGASAVTHVPADPIPDDLVVLMAERGVVSIPTLAVHTELVDFLDAKVLDNPMAQALSTDALIEAYRSDEIVLRFADSRRRLEQRSAVILASVKKMAGGGVTILTGTDSGNWATIQGYSLHRELVKLVAAGLTPWQALAASTTDAGTFLGRSYGVNPGDEANLVVLEASPIMDIRNTQQIALVIHHGVVVDRGKLLARELTD